MSGFIDTDYAEPNAQLNLRSIRQRLYRGFCADNDHLDATVQKFIAARPDIEATITASPINESQREKVLEYLDEGYQTLTTPESFQEEILDRCRGGA